MDIVNRLKKFMNALGVANSQFADTCRIPRPTISQILNGRNKKISDELISKIHEAYPQLSVLWLMFGEGDMLNGLNIEFSGLKNSSNCQSGSIEISENKPIMGQLDFDSYQQNSMSDNLLMPKQQIMSLSEHSEGGDNITEVLSEKIDCKPKILYGKDKRVIEIRVFYDDNSYEIFVPQVK